ncbi:MULTISPECIES: hypothetical protein [unclassified Neorhizobium]|uniref:hypothetical protein n=1 Tax=unclassified Neorhizobium TaxID=2629175 RepID=UPI001FF2895E|nr:MULTISPECIES: hypothetical protein [unclassified Neorhizobium]MCJ9673284.1 hypothetical protein [Neorhizobium sp. SHOUNA12B]MCJ9748674.1 hypothetical protein [Neorhizobium sp. SHOUNA12A]
MVQMRNGGKAPPLDMLVGDIARMRQIAEENRLDLLCYLLRIAECEAWELVSKAEAAQDHLEESSEKNRQPI